MRKINSVSGLLTDEVLTDLLDVVVGNYLMKMYSPDGLETTKKLAVEKLESVFGGDTNLDGVLTDSTLTSLVDAMVGNFLLNMYKPDGLNITKTVIREKLETIFVS